MRFRFTKHSIDKLLLIEKYGFNVTQDMVKAALRSPLRVDIRPDGTFVANASLSKKLILRVAHRYEDDIIIIITVYPGRRKAYGL
ncbi:MAG: hypothetical protein AAB557_00230 [Patescibacteria group bacterium]